MLVLDGCNGNSSEFANLSRTLAQVGLGKKPSPLTLVSSESEELVPLHRTAGLPQGAGL